MVDPMETPRTSVHPTRTRLLELKSRLNDLQLEALRRGFGVDPAETPASFDDIDTIVAEVAADVEQLRANRDRVQQPQRDGDQPATSRGVSPHPHISRQCVGSDSPHWNSQ